MVLERVKKGVKKVLQLGALVGALALPVKSTATDFYNVSLDFWRNPDNYIGQVNFYGGHFGWVEGRYLESANLGPGPPGYTKIVAYTEFEGSPYKTDYRELESLEDYFIKVRYMSETTPNFDGRSQIKFNFYNLEPVEKINSNMFYWGEFILPAEFSTNGVEKVDKKAMLSNFDASRDVYFNLDGITNVVHNDDFAQFNIYRTPNSFYFQQPSDGSVAVSNVTESVAVTNTQRFAYDTMTNSEFNVKVDANEGRHLRGLEVVLQDINTGDFKTNSFSFPTNAPYTNSFSTNVVGAAGSNSVRNVEFGTNQYDVSLTSKYSPWFGTNTIGNPEATPNPVSHGNNTSITVDKYVVDPENPGRRVRFKEWKEE